MLAISHKRCRTNTCRTNGHVGETVMSSNSLSHKRWSHKRSCRRTIHVVVTVVALLVVAQTVMSSVKLSNKRSCRRINFVEPVFVGKTVGNPCLYQKLQCAQGVLGSYLPLFFLARKGYSIFQSYNE
jgi:hypothetical protein